MPFVTRHQIAGLKSSTGILRCAGPPTPLVANRGLVLLHPMSIESSIPAPRRSAGRGLYTWAALAAVVVVFAGFSRTYYLKSVFGTPALTTLVHLHGVVMTLWFTLF